MVDEICVWQEIDFACALVAPDGASLAEPIADSSNARSCGSLDITLDAQSAPRRWIKNIPMSRNGNNERRY
jgi:hypothetical protein